MSAERELVESLAAMDTVEVAELVCDTIESADDRKIERLLAAAEALGDPMLEFDLLAVARARQDPELVDAVLAVGKAWS